MYSYRILEIKFVSALEFLLKPLSFYIIKIDIFITICGTTFTISLVYMYY